MADKTNIEWTDGGATWNVITGCTPKDGGCKHCYAANLIATWPALGNHPSRKGLARKNAQGVATFTGEVRFNHEWLDQPLRWRKPRKIFVCAHGDLFHESVPEEWIDKVFAVMALAPHHTFQVLTKRPERARAYLSDIYRRAAITPHMRKIAQVEVSDSVGIIWPLPNVWLGTSISDQASADLRIPELLATPAAVRFISAEPLLGPVDLTKISTMRFPRAERLNALTGEISGIFGDPAGRVGKINWVIVGGESGQHARPMHPEWARSIRDQCAAAGVAYFFKQWGEWADLSDHEGRRDWFLMSHDGDVDIPDGRWPDETKGEAAIIRVGKKAAGALLDGREHKEFPNVPRP